MEHCERFSVHLSQHAFMRMEARMATLVPHEKKRRK